MAVDQAHAIGRVGVRPASRAKALVALSKEGRFLSGGWELVASERSRWIASAHSAGAS